MTVCQAARRVIVSGALLSSPCWAEGATRPESAPRTETVQAFADYVRAAESRVHARLEGTHAFLWASTPERRAALRKGQLVCEPVAGRGEIRIPHGLIHDWVSAVFVPNTGVQEILNVVQDYDNHKHTYRPEVIDSQTIQRNGDDFTVRLRLLKKKVITVVLETEHQARYRQLAPDWWVSNSRSTRIAEIDDYGRPSQHERPAGQDRGFLWRLNSYWSIREGDGGTYLECEAISLTRSVPAALRWMIDPIVRSLARDSLVNTLRATRTAVAKLQATPTRPSGS